MVTWCYIQASIYPFTKLNECTSLTFTRGSIISWRSVPGAAAGTVDEARRKKEFNGSTLEGAK